MRLVNVSNRITIPRRTAAPGGLAVGVLAAMRARGGLWFGASGETSAKETIAPKLMERDQVTYATIDVPDAIYAPYYNGFANGTLWPLLHSFLGTFHYSAAEYGAYDAVNSLFAEHLAPLLTDDDLVWIHDYHLVPLAHKLRERGVRNRLGFFLHIPFPPYDVLRALPVCAELLGSLLAFDLLGFQTEGDQLNFLATAAALWGETAVGSDSSVHVAGRRTMTGVFPIGVDVEEIEKSANEAMQSKPVRQMQVGLQDRPLMIGVDRLDYSKGLLERFAAYREFLETYPEQQNRVVYVQIAPLSRTDVRAYVKLRAALEQSSGRTNGLYADTDWTPIRYLNRNFPRNVLMGFFRLSQVGLVTPVRDGMNLVAKEFVAAQDPANPGVLVLSSLAGAAAELKDALLVNPYDSSAIAKAMQTALTMPLEERRERHRRSLQVLRTNDIHHWYKRFLQTLYPVELQESAARVVAGA
ncbi:MAG TPA: trehalose-6-phosphate synthase [Steroidobacteraceae bacterium]|nr:trehalose-6-phosphate synthase [Steroidobacteraceae bacterium]HRX89538.1 trehalose-6-phosphate synthase [Steroidobacteraceae bacterium]